jgi:acetate---CoA ligase (ADP-forming)
VIILIEYSTFDLSYLLSPQSVAYIGATMNTDTIAGRVLVNLQKSHYKGQIYPVHSEYDEIFGLKTYPNLMSIPSQVDTVIIIPSAISLARFLKECEEKKVKFIILLSPLGGLEETQQELLETLKAFSKKTGIRVLGPNSYGLLNIAEPFGVSSSLLYEPNRLQNGKISLITVDGGLGRAILDANDLGIGFNYWISTGDEADLDVTDFINCLTYDSSTQVVFAVVDGIKDKQKFQNAIELANNARKPIILLNISQSEMGIEGNQAGIILTTDIDEMLEIGWLFNTYGMPAGNRIGIFSYSSGIRKLIANKCRLVNLPVPDLTNKTKSLLQDCLPNLTPVANPIHLTTSVFDNLWAYREYLEIFANDPNLDLIFVPFPYKLGSYTEMLVRQTVEVAKRMNKPIIPIWTSLSGEMETSFEILIESQLPFYRTTEAAILAVKRFTDYYMNRMF